MQFWAHLLLFLGPIIDLTRSPRGAARYFSRGCEEKVPEITQEAYNPTKRTRTYAFFSDGVKKLHLLLAVVEFITDFSSASHIGPFESVPEAHFTVLSWSYPGCVSAH